MATHYEHAHYMTKWRIRYAQSLTRCINPRLRNYQEKDKQRVTALCATKWSRFIPKLS
jgi:hypothetical protein